MTTGRRLRRFVALTQSFYRAPIAFLAATLVVGVICVVVVVPLLCVVMDPGILGKRLQGVFQSWGLPGVSHIRLGSLWAWNYFIALLVGVLLGLYRRHKPVLLSVAFAFSFVSAPIVWFPPYNRSFGQIAHLLAFDVPTALLLVIPAWLLSRRRRIPPGHCATCGYDLRASKKRCPECGAAIGAAAK